MRRGYNALIAMRANPQDVDSFNPAELRDKALNLRESVNSSRARMSAQTEKMERLRREIAELRASIDKTLPAPAADSFKTGARYRWRKPVPYIAIFLAAVGMQLRGSRSAAPSARSAVPAAPVVATAPSTPAAIGDNGADEALLLAHDWRLPGDERPLSERLGSDTNPPGTQPEWTAEPTGERTYRVSFRPSGSDTGYDFDVDLAARRVDPTPETAELISPRLASRR